MMVIVTMLPKKNGQLTGLGLLSWGNRRYREHESTSLYWHLSQDLFSKLWNYYYQPEFKL